MMTVTVFYALLSQSERWGAVLETEDVTEVDFSVRPFVIKSAERTVKAHSVIIATGATAKRLGIPSEEKFWSNGISACAICDGGLPRHVYRSSHEPSYANRSRQPSEAFMLCVIFWIRCRCKPDL
jgi:hypothetical protein